MKHFNLVGPQTTTEFDIRDDEMLEWYAIKMNQYEINLVEDHQLPMDKLEVKNRVIYPTEKS